MNADSEAERAGAAGPAGQAGREPVEVEAKLGVSRPRRIARLIRDLDSGPFGDFAAAGPVRVVVHTDRYLDTAEPGGLLFERGARARLRRHGRTVTLAVKHSASVAAGITTRTELEGPATDSTDPGRWPESGARAALVAAVGGRPLLEIARLRQLRLTRLVRGHGATVELSLDREDAIVQGRVVERRYELEAELKAGDASGLERLLEALTQVPGLGPPAGSKLAFALAARASGASPSPTRPGAADDSGAIAER